MSLDQLWIRVAVAFESTCCFCGSHLYLRERSAEVLRSVRRLLNRPRKVLHVRIRTIAAESSRLRAERDREQRLLHPKVRVDYLLALYRRELHPGEERTTAYAV